MLFNTINIAGMTLDTATIIMYINIAFGVLVFLRAFVGFVRGTKKSIFYLIATIIVYVGGWFLMNKAIDALMGLDLGFITSMGVPSTISINGQTVAVTTAGQMIEEIVSGMLFSGADLTDTVTIELVTAVVAIALRIVYFIILIILSDTVLKWIFDIIWLFIRPKKVENEKGKKKRPKPGFLSRLGGFGIGAVKGAFLLLILFFLVGGIASIVTDVSDVMELSEETEKYDLVLLGNSMTLVAEEETESSTDLLGGLKDTLKEYQDYIDIINGYRQTIPGKIYGTIKIKGDAIDEYIFDELLAINVDYEDGDYKLNESIKLRKELQTILTAFNELLESDPEALDKISSGKYDELNAEALSKCIEELSSLTTIKVVVPVGVEFLLLSDTLTDGNESLKKLIEDNYKALRNGTSTLGADIEKLGYVFVDVMTLISAQEDLANLDYFSFDPTTVANIFNKLGDLGILDTYAPIIIEYVLSMDSIKTAVENLGLDFEEVKQAILDIDDWGNEVSQLGVIVSKVLDLGISGSNFAEMDFSKIDISKVESLVEAIFNSQLIEEALPILVDVGLDKVGGEEGSTTNKIISALNISKDTDWEAELKPLINCALVLLKSGLISNDTIKNGKIVDALKNVSEDELKEIGKYLSESNLLTNGLNEIIKELLSGDKIELLNGVEIQVFTDEEMAAGNGWSQDEITAILLTAKDLLSSGILSTEEGSDLTSAFTKLDSATIENIATHLSQSTFFKRNLSAILKSVFNTLLNTGEESTLEITVLTESEWTKEELSSIFNSVVDLVNIGLLDDDVVSSIKTLSDAKISSLAANVSGSRFITSNFGNIIDYAIGKADIGFDITGLKEMTWDKNEISTILKAARDVLSFIDGKEVTDILGCSDQTMINNLLNSKVLVTSIGSFVRTNSEVDAEGNRNPNATMDLTIIKGADKLTDDDWADTVLNDTITFTVSGTTLSVQNEASILTSLNADRLDVYADGEWVGYITDGTFSFESLIGEDKLFTAMPENDKIVVKARKNGELRRIFAAFNVLFPEGNVDVENIDANIIIDLSDDDLDTLLDSVILTETISSVVKELDTRNADGTGDTTIYVDVDRIETKGWKEEIKSMVKAVKIVLGENPDLENANPDVNTILAANDEDLNKMLGSIIITDTIIKAIYDQSNYDYLGNAKTGGTINIPLDSSSNPYTLTSDFWRDQDSEHPGEIRKLFKAVQALFEETDPETGEKTYNIDFDNINANAILDLTDARIDTLLASEILECTIKKYIVELDTRSTTGDTTIYVDETKIDTVGWATEIKAMVKAVKVVLGENPDLNNANPNVNEILAANDADLDKILASVIITDTLIKTLYDQSDYDYLGNPRTGGTINIPLDSSNNPYLLTSDFWRDQDSEHPGEIRKLFRSIQTLFTKKDPVTGEDVLTVDFDNINADAIFDLTETKIDTLLNSDVMNCTCAEILEDVMYATDGALYGMIWEPATNRLQYVEANQGDLFKTLINLKDLFNISYTGITFDNFKNAVATDGDAYVMSEVLCGSLIVENSLNTMFNKLIGENASLTADIRTSVTTNLNNITSWSNVPTYSSTKHYGELALMLRALTVLTTLDAAPSIDAATMNDPLQKLNASKVLQPVVSKLLDKALDSVGSWKKSGTVSLSQAEWSKEIELMVELVDFADTNFSSGLGSVSNASSLDSNILENLIKYISRSRILDINNINDIVETAVNAVWSGAYQTGNTVASDYTLGVEGTIDVSLENPTQGSSTAATLTVTYTNAEYDAFVAAWAIEAVAIRDAIAQLNKIDFSDVTEMSIHDDVNNEDYIGYVYLKRMIGRFLDKCELASTLQPTVASIAGTYSVSKGSYASWEEAFANATISF